MMHVKKPLVSKYYCTVQTKTKIKDENNQLEKTVQLCDLGFDKL